MSLRSAVAAVACASFAGAASAQMPSPAANPYFALSQMYQLPAANGASLAGGPGTFPQVPPQPVNYLESPPPYSGWSDPWAAPSPVESRPRRRQLLADGTDATDPKFSFEAEYLFFQLKSIDSPIALATTGPAGSFGLPGGANVQSFGRDLDGGTHSGIRVSGGVWINPQAGYGVEASAFYLEERGGSVRLRSDAAGNPTIARPFFDTAGNTTNVRLVALPGAFTGSLAIDSSSLFWGADYTPVFRVMQREQSSLDLIAGFRYYSLEESLTVADRSTALGSGRSTFNGVAVAGTAVMDRFATQNRFYGGVFGARYNVGYEKFTLNLIAKFAVGAVREYATVEGQTLPIGTAGFAPNGLLAQSTNTGRSRSTDFSFAPDLMAKLWYNLTPGLAVYGGYNVMYLTDVVRPDGLIDAAVNANRVPSSPSFGQAGGGLRPLRRTDSTEFWAHGASAGVMFIY